MMRAYLGSSGLYMDGVCDTCSGQGLLGDPGQEDRDRPGQMEVTVTCYDCNGTGGSDPEKVQKFRALSRAYCDALTGDDPVEVSDGLA